MTASYYLIILNLLTGGVTSQPVPNNHEQCERMAEEISSHTWGNENKSYSAAMCLPAFRYSYEIEKG